MEARSQLRHRPTNELLLVYTTRPLRRSIGVRLHHRNFNRRNSKFRQVVAVESKPTEFPQERDLRPHSHGLRATANQRKASVERMGQNMHEASPHPKRFSLRIRGFIVGSVFLFLLFWMRIPTALALQAAPPASSQTTPQANPTPPAPDLNGSLRSALAQTGAAVNQVQIDRWKVSREWKGQLHSDANSIQQDLTTQLPGLFLAVQQSPAALQPQLSLMHNVDALYDVLVRITTAAGLAGGKTDAAILDNAVQQLESARKAAAGQLLQAASQQDRKITELQTRVQNTPESESPVNNHPKTIVVENRVTHRTKHRQTPHRKVAPKSNPSSPDNGTGSTGPHPTTP